MGERSWVQNIKHALAGLVAVRGHNSRARKRAAHHEGYWSAFFPLIFHSLYERTCVMAYLSVQPAAVLIVNVPLSQALSMASSNCEP